MFRSIISLLLSSTRLLAQDDNAIQMCPCMLTESTCVQYDRRFQAYDLDEAVAAFPDLSLKHDESLHPPKTVDEEKTCASSECDDCKKVLKSRLRNVGLFQSPVDPFLSNDIGNTSCYKYRFSNPRFAPFEDKVEGMFTDMHKEAGALVKKIESKFLDKLHHMRYQRQVTSDGSMIGIRYPISCTSKGAPTDATGKVSLCRSCWVWRKLPEHYSPQYVNELICDTTDTVCLSGYASCSTGTHNVEVARNDSGNITMVALSAGSYCECKAYANSAIQSLISGTGVPVSVPALSTSTVSTIVG